jgi:hypothetical protein
MTDFIAPELTVTPPALNDERECPICESEGTYVDIGFDGVCTVCSHAPNSETSRNPPSDPWGAWFEHRKDNYSGFHGEERKKCVGGFIGAYDFEEDF